MYNLSKGLSFPSTPRFNRGFCTPQTKSKSIKQDKTAKETSPPIQTLTHDKSMLLKKAVTLFDHGQSLINQEQYGQAEISLITSLQLAKRLEDPIMVGKVSLMLGYSYNLRDVFDRAENHLKEAIELLKDKEQIKAGFGLSYLAEVYSKTNKFPQAVEVAKQALKLLEKDNTFFSVTQNNLAGYLHANKQYPEAQSLCESALSFFEQTVGHNNPLTRSCRVNLSAILRDSGQEKRLSELQSRWLASIKKGAAEIAEKAKKDFDLKDLQYCEQQWHDMELKRLDPPGMFVPTRIANKEEHFFSKAWKNQL
jgi:tetratricopeptide (TPR) repeat protein